MFTAYFTVALSILVLIVTYKTYTARKFGSFSIGLDLFIALLIGAEAVAHFFIQDYLGTILYGISALNWFICFVFGLKNKKLFKLDTEEDSETFEEVEELEEESVEEETSEEDSEEEAEEPSDEDENSLTE